MEDDLEDMEAVLNLSLQKLGYSKLRDGQKRVVDLVRTHARYHLPKVNLEQV